VVFLIVGESPLRPSLELLASRLGIRTQVHFAGAVRQPAIAAAYAAMDVFVMPSLMPSETFGIVLIEAMSRAVPVVSFGVFGQTEAIIEHHDVINHHTEDVNRHTDDIINHHQEDAIDHPDGVNYKYCAADTTAHCQQEAITRVGNAVVVREASPAALARGVVGLLLNATLRAEVGAQARRTVEGRFTARRNGQAMTAVYRALMRV
jgi:glycosyltransferase involved in cell wall biosynthesis